MPLSTFPGRHAKMIANVLRAGGVGVMPTDTIYGIVGSALNKRSVERIYRLRKRNLKKPMIILISSLADLKTFGIVPRAASRKILRRVWPGKVSVILPCRSKRFAYLHRGTNGLAFRMPKPVWLNKFLKKTGPLVAPSANTEGAVPARTVGEAKKYFGDKIDFYVDAGRIVSEPSTLIEVRKGGVQLIRQGGLSATHRE